jgi:hypothetical protein
MALYADRVKQSVTSPGSGTVTLPGSASTGYQTFLNAFGSGSTVVAYCIADQSGNSWEVGTGTYDGTANTLTRSTILASSNSNSLVNFASGVQDVFCTAPAKYLDTFTSTNQGVVPASGGGTANFLRADGTFATPTATAPAGSDTQIQYNNAGAFGANANFFYTSGTNTLTLGAITSPSGGLTLTPFAPAAGTAPAALVLLGAASQDANAGGQVQITAGAALTPSTGVGGSIVMKGGNTSGTANGGAFNLTGGDGAVGGGFILTSGRGLAGNSGNFTIGSGGGGLGSGSFSFGTATGGSGNSGNQSFSTGSSAALTGTTGSLTFTTGAQTNGGTSGSFTVNLGASATGTGGSIILRPGSGATKGNIRLRSSLTTDVVQITDNGTANLLGFFAVAPVVRQTTAAASSARVAGAGAAVTDTDTFGGYTIGQIVTALQSYGLLT